MSQDVFRCVMNSSDNRLRTRLGAESAARASKRGISNFGKLEKYPVGS
jgi:hypothetical protein